MSSSSSTKYTTNIEHGVLDILSDELEKKSRTERLHKFYLEQLNNFVKELPSAKRAIFTETFRTHLVNSLLDGTVFQIVKGLEEIQEMSERNLFQHRMQTVQSLKGQKQEMERRHKDEYQRCQYSRAHHLPLLQAGHIKEQQKVQSEHEQEMRSTDMKVIRDLDQLVSEQQLNLEKARVPSFRVTNNPHDIQTQMYVLKFIRNLRDKEPAPG